MDIYIHIKGNGPVRLAWMCPFLPRIGEHLFIDDFCPDADTLKDTLVVEDIQWHILNKEICASIFLGDDSIEADEREINLKHLN
jgi:hypothetical protein